MNSFDLHRLRAGVKPFRVHYSSRLRSTNDHAAEMRRTDRLFAPAIVLTSNQLAGRGRGRNTWFSGAGCLTVTFALPIDEQFAPHQLPLVAGMAVRNAIGELLARDEEALLKWPNDVLVRGRKVAGLLCERIHRLDLIGMGVNVNLDVGKAPAELRGRIGSLGALAGRGFDMTEVLIAVASHLKLITSRRDEVGFGALLREYDRHHALVGREIEVTFSAREPEVRGRCEGLDEVGRLLVREAGTVHRIIAGHVEMM